jgi:CheY-like chemotaxis protein/AraC-like DNA-binding protein
MLSKNLECHPTQPHSERFDLVTAGHHFLLKVLPFREPESHEALADFFDATECCQLAPPDIDAVLLRCLAVLGPYADRIPSLVDRYLSDATTITSPAIRFTKCIEDVLKFRAVSDGTVQEVLEFVTTHYYDVACTPDAIAAKVGLRLPTLCVLVRQHTGRTLRQHIREERLNQAAKLLATTNKSIKEIWADVGYCHASNFDHDFKHLLGVAPRDYRAGSFRPAAKTVYGYAKAQTCGSRVPSSTSRRRKAVLIVDDDDSSRWLVSTFLESKGDNVEMAGSGEEGLKMANQLSSDVILLDYHLGDMNGLEFLRLLRESRNRVVPPVVVFTADWDVITNSDRFAALNAVALSKLCDLERVGDVVSYLVPEASSSIA